MESDQMSDIVDEVNRRYEYLLNKFKNSSQDIFDRDALSYLKNGNIDAGLYSMDLQVNKPLGFLKDENEKSNEITLN